MRAPALVAVEEGPAAFASLFAAAAAAGERVGWLELASPPAHPGPLEEAAAQGALRAVAAGAGRTVSVKPTRGAPVLRDLLREHFLGCSLVLVRGHAGHPRLTPAGDDYRLELAPALDGSRGGAADRGRVRMLAAGAALAELLRPRHAPPRRRDRPERPEAAPAAEAAVAPAAPVAATGAEAKTRDFD